ncbi:hypothetical protein N8I77_010833 [Diaporthe amygdali]|uniref:Transcription factor domain-containing protein n=1 Tax=Phomopsis amygdali TaxID=1214568 RepID=A0AAD9W290_PHOAM|nr:hypothetical protein N8I77_010833 [Diaporthe amygdali]
MADMSHRLAMERIAQGDVQLSTLQTLCLLSMVDFTGGRTLRALMSCDHALQLLQKLIWFTSPSERKLLVQNHEFVACVQSLITLRNLHAAGCSTTIGNLPRSVNTSSNSQLTNNPLLLSARSDKEDDILVFTNQLAEVWQMASCYAACPADSNTPPPWTSESDYSYIMSRHLDIDSRVPMKYRFHENNFQDREPAELHEQRGYWGPWLFVQFVYAAIPCLLNHPFLLSMRLRNFRHTMPQSFIQQSFEQITRHAGWIMYFLDVLESKSFQISDPVLGHCVAIIATIHLQHSFVRNDTLRTRAQNGFEKCMTFLRRMGRIWPNIAVMANKLQRLQQSIVVVVDVSVSGMDGHRSEGPDAQTWSIDAALLWEILVYEKAGCCSLPENLSSVFGDSLLPKSPTPETSAQEGKTEFDLIGSEGIAGHKTVHRQTPLHAPGQSAWTLDSIPPLQRGTPVPDVAHTESSPTILETMGGSQAQQGFFLGADDYGRTIDAWLDLDLVP